MDEKQNNQSNKSEFSLKYREVWLNPIVYPIVYPID